MIHAYVPRNGSVERVDIAADTPVPATAMWFDVFEPTPEERGRLETALHVQLPTREEMQEIEPSSRLYSEGDVSYMTATIMAHTDTPFPMAEPITFVLTRRALITLRYHEPRPIRTYSQRLMKNPGSCNTGQEVLVGLLEALVDRIADVLERVALDLDAQARIIFESGPAQPTGSQRDMQAVIRALGHDEDLATSARESLLGLNRVIRFLTQAIEAASPEIQSKKEIKEQKQRIKTLLGDMASIGEHAAFELHKVNFLLDATLGTINIEQNRIIKLFSVAAVVFLPPTLVASIYGMNFQHMPELEWLLGYPMAVVLMVLSAVLPYLYFKRKGWF
jgi:magnesium transporter